MNERPMRRVSWSSFDGEKQFEGWFHQFITAADGNGINCVYAVIESDNGRIETIEVCSWYSLRFITPYQTPHNLAADGLDDARNHDPRPLAEIEAEMERAREWVHERDGAMFALGVDPMEPDYRALADEEPRGDDRDCAEGPQAQ